jgi:hypothetical protein
LDASSSALNLEGLLLPLGFIGENLSRTVLIRRQSVMTSSPLGNPKLSGRATLCITFSLWFIEFMNTASPDASKMDFDRKLALNFAQRALPIESARRTSLVDNFSRIEEMCDLCYSLVRFELDFAFCLEIFRLLERLFGFSNLDDPPISRLLPTGYSNLTELDGNVS